MKTAAVFLLVSLCAVSVQAQKKVTDIPDFLTFETSFGDVDVPPEYLIADPSGIITDVNAALDRDDNLYIYDEMRVKVFGPHGEPKAIIGRPGKGPGEFEAFEGTGGFIRINSRGYITVMSGLRPFHTFQVFDPGYDYVRNFYTNEFKSVPGTSQSIRSYPAI